MNLEEEAREWLIQHDISADSPFFERDVRDLVDFIEGILQYEMMGGHIGPEPEYDPNFGDNKECECGHVYYRHFDTYDNMSPIG